MTKIVSSFGQLKHNTLMGKVFGFEVSDEVYNDLVEATAVKYGYQAKITKRPAVAGEQVTTIDNPETKEEFMAKHIKQFAQKILAEGGAKLAELKARDEHLSKIQNLKL